MKSGCQETAESWERAVWAVVFVVVVGAAAAAVVDGWGSGPSRALAARLHHEGSFQARMAGVER